MRERFGRRSRIIGRQQQLEVVAAIQEQLDKLKAAIESIDPEARRKIRELSQEERAELREKTAQALRQRVNAVQAIDRELDKLRMQRRIDGGPGANIRELREIHEIAVKENATKTAGSIEKLIARTQRQGLRRDRPGRDRPERPDRPDRAGRAEAENRAKPFSLQTFDGKTVELAAYRDKVVVLEWFNFECPFVKYHYDKADTMIELAKKYKGQGVVWLAINSTSHTKPADNVAFAAKHELPYPLLDDRSGEVGRAYGAKTTPHMFVIAPGGRIVYEGAIDNAPLGRTPAGKEKVNYVDRVLADLVAGRDLSAKNTKPYGCSVKYPK
jgi:peroxiredoxin